MFFHFTCKSCSRNYCNLNSVVDNFVMFSYHYAAFVNTIFVYFKVTVEYTTLSEILSNNDFFLMYIFNL